MRRARHASRVIPDNCADATLCGNTAELIARCRLGNGELHDNLRVRRALSRRRAGGGSNDSLSALRPKARRPTPGAGSRIVSSAATTRHRINSPRKTAKEAA